MGGGDGERETETVRENKREKNRTVRSLNFILLGP